MNLNSLARHFSKMGADIDIQERYGDINRFSTSGFSIDIRGTGRNEHFLLEVFRKDMEFHVLNILPRERHLLLLARDSAEVQSKLLCGHDERHWFTCEVRAARNVQDAWNQLKPADARESQRKNGVRVREMNKRHNKGFIRQGEWFFIPAPEMVAAGYIHRNEPLSRGGGSKAHIVQEVFRTLGETRWVSRRHPNGVTQEDYDILIKQPEMRKLYWTQRTLTTGVYARGRVSHPDHATIVLPFWHLVRMNMESTRTSASGGPVAFLD